MSEPNETQSDGEQREYEVTAEMASDEATSGRDAKRIVVEASSREAAEEKVKSRNGVEAVLTEMTMEVERNENGAVIY